jgi:NAD+ kinase
VSRVVIFVHQERPEAAEVARAIHDHLAAGGHEVVLPPHDARVVGLTGLAASESHLTEGRLDLAVAVGGDGTILRTVFLVAGLGVPVLGVNVGQLGYLNEVEPSDAVAAIDKVLAGDFEVEERMQLRVHVETSDEDRRARLAGVPSDALNEAVVEKTPMGHTVRLSVRLGGEFFTTYAADGLIVATATGSTAYSFSARGPILDPVLHAIVITPVSPHMLFDRSMVVAPDVEVRLEVLGHRPATLSIDGRNVGQLYEGDAVVCTASPVPARLVSFKPRDFHQILKTKFGLADR